MPSARRALHSVTIYKPQKAYPGFTLFSPMTQVPGNTWLMDMQGRFVHRWKLPGWVRLHADLLPNGNLLAAIEDVDAPPSSAPTVAKSVVEIDWDGQVVWQYDDPFMDAHDRKRSRNGNTLIMKYAEVPKEIAAKVKGGLHLGELAERIGDMMFGNVIQEITPDGKIAWEWIGYEHFDPELDALASMQKRLVWVGLNSLEELPNGDLMICSFGCDNLFIIDRSTGDIKWRWGKGDISMPHNPTMLDNGNVLVLDNNRFHTQYFPPDYSRLVEVNPKTNEIEWEFKEENPVDFCTTYIGGCERLPNGNTLVCEGAMGRFFEINTMGEVVWEYIVPFYHHRDTLSPYGLSNCTFRCHRYGPDYPGLQGKTLRPEKLDLWNRLYGPEAFDRSARLSPSTGAQDCNSVQDAEELSAAQAAVWEEARPGSDNTEKQKKMEARLKRLGY